MGKRLERKTSEIYQGPTVAPIKSGPDKLFGLTGTLPQVVEIDLGWIDSQPEQPRKTFNDAALQSLAVSIREHGLKQPILVRQEESGRYMLIAGERRLRAHRINGAEKIVAIVLKDDDPDATALLENMQRVDLNAVELATAVIRLLDRPNYTQEKVAPLIGLKSHTQVSRLLRILKLPQQVLNEYPAHAEAVSRATLIEIAEFDDPEAQLALWEKAKMGIGSKEIRECKRRAPTAEDVDGRMLRIVSQAMLKASKEIEKLAQYREILVKEHLDRLQSLREQIDAILGDQ
jgi:ParB family transcriptional regulator, chromosome partitioning protein